MSAHSASEIGKRDSNEDQHFVFFNLNGNIYPSLAPINLFCIFDGHGGSKVSALLLKILCPKILSKENTFPLDKKIVRKIYDRVQEKIIHLLKKDAMDMGSTALVVIQYMSGVNQYLQVFNVGDSRLVIN